MSDSIDGASEAAPDNKVMPDPVIEMLLRLQQMPALYIGRASIDDLWMYLQGYTNALRDHVNVPTLKYRSFITSLVEKYGLGGGGHSWAWVLKKKAGGDTAGLELFFKELDDFVQSDYRWS